MKKKKIGRNVLDAKYVQLKYAIMMIQLHIPSSRIIKYARKKIFFFFLENWLDIRKMQRNTEH